MSALSQPRTLANCLLCAVPQLMDVNFQRSVVLVLGHGQDGALGLVLNRALPVSVQELATELDLRWTGHPEQAVRHGGPVSPERGWILHDQARWDPHAQELVDGKLWLTTSLDHLRGHQPRAYSPEHSSFGEDMRVIFALGYAGWDGGQLESELAGGSWVVVPIVEDLGADALQVERGVSTDWLFQTEPPDMWELALASIGIDPLALVGMHPSGEMLQ